MSVKRYSWKMIVLLLSIVMVLGMICYTFFYLNYDPYLVNLEERFLGMSMSHPMGTDQLGRDELTRILIGGKQTISFSLIALGASLLIGVPFGLVAGYKGGIIDKIFMRIADMFMSFPDTIVAIVLCGLIGPSVSNLVFAIVFVKWVSYARLVRSTVLVESQKEYILIAKTNGLSTWKIIRKHLFPHIIGNVVVMASLDIGKIILLISSFSYIGLGVQPPTPEWGNMLNDSRPYFQSRPELMMFPGLAIVLVVLTTNLLGDYLRDKFDVKKEVE